MNCTTATVRQPSLQPTTVPLQLHNLVSLLMQVVACYNQNARDVRSAIDIW